MLRINMVSPSGATFKMMSDISSGDIFKVLAIGGVTIISCYAITNSTPINLHLRFADKEAEISIGNGKISLNGGEVLTIDSAVEKVMNF